MRKTLVSSLLIGLMLTFVSLPVSQAATKAGATCKKVGVTSSVGGKKYTCILSGKKLVWNKGAVSTNVIPTGKTPVTPTPKPTPTAALGSFSLPIPSGTDFQIGKLKYRVNQVKFNVDSVVCAGNYYNGGCTVDSNFRGIVDPASTTTWVAVAFTILNQSADIQSLRFDTSFYLVLPNGQLLQNTDTVNGYPNRLDNVQLIPGGSGTGDVLFAVPKTAAVLKTMLVLRDSSDFLSTHDYYFEISW